MQTSVVDNNSTVVGSGSLFVRLPRMNPYVPGKAIRRNIPLFSFLLHLHPKVHFRLIVTTDVSLLSTGIISHAHSSLTSHQKSVGESGIDFGGTHFYFLQTDSHIIKLSVILGPLVTDKSTEELCPDISFCKTCGQNMNRRAHTV